VAEDTGEIRRKKFQIAYLGDVADDHAMDVEALAPALLGFGRLMRAVNADLNKDQAKVKVLVESDFEDKCFNINFELVQTILDTIRGFLSDKEAVQDAKDILTKVGIITGVGGTVAAGIFGYLKAKNGRTVASTQTVKDSTNTIIVNLNGDGPKTLIIDKDVFRLAEHNKEVVQSIQATLVPIDERGEAKALEFRENDLVVTTLQRDDVKAIVASCETALLGAPIEEKQAESEPHTVTANLYVHGAVFDPKAQNWRFRYKGEHIFADIRETRIAADAVKRGTVSKNDRYRVKMEVTDPKDEDGKPHYKIIEVLEFKEAEQQIPLALKKPRKKAAKRAGRKG
jgi:hypothetical protein